MSHDAAALSGADARPATRPAAAQALLDQVAGELERCNKCGFCMAGCPTYQATGWEWAVTRGRVELVKGVAQGRATWEDAELAIDTCLMCRACVAHCPPQVQIDQIIAAARAARTLEEGLHPVKKLFFRALLPNLGWMRALARVGAFAEGLGLRRFADRSGLIRMMPKMVQTAAQVGPSLPAQSGRALIARVHRAEQRRWAAERAAGRGPRARVAYFLGCTKDLVFARAALATYRVLAANDVEVLLVDHACCGLPARSGGDPIGERLMARRNLAAFQRLDVDAIVCDEGSCTGHLRDYGHILAGTPDEDAARRFADQVQDLAVFLTRLGPKPMGRLSAASLDRLSAGQRAAGTPVAASAAPADRPLVVTWHDACHLKHYMGVAQEPRALIQAIPGVKFVESALSDVCCGGAGTFMINHPEMSEDILRRKMGAFAASQADCVVSGSPSCMIQLHRGVRELLPADDGEAAGAGRRMRALYLSELLELAYDAAAERLGWGQHPQVRNRTEG